MEAMMFDVVSLTGQLCENIEKILKKDQRV